MAGSKKLARLIQRKTGCRYMTALARTRVSCILNSERDAFDDYYVKLKAMPDHAGADQLCVWCFSLMQPACETRGCKGNHAVTQPPATPGRAGKP